MCHWQRSDQQCPLVDLGRDQRGDGSPALAAGGEDGRDDEFGGFGGQRSEPLHQQEPVEAQLGPGGNQIVGEGFGTEQDHRAGSHEQADDSDAPAAVGQLPECGSGTDQLWLFHVAVADLVEVEAEPGQQQQPERQVDLATRRYGERNHTGDQQEPEFDPVSGLQRQTGGLSGADLAGHQHADQHHDRPAQAHQQPVGPGHVGGGVLGVIRVVARYVCVVQVNGVFGQYSDQREYGDRKPAGDVDLRGFGGPRQQEAGGDHRGPINQQGGNRVQMKTGNSDHQCGNDEYRDDQGRTGQGAPRRPSRHRDWTKGPVYGEHRDPSTHRRVPSGGGYFGSRPWLDPLAQGTRSTPVPATLWIFKVATSEPLSLLARPYNFQS